MLTRSENIAPLLTARPELMVHELTMDSLTESLEWADVVVIGPGLGQQEWGKKSPAKSGEFSQTDVVGCRCIEPAGNQSR